MRYLALIFVLGLAACLPEEEETGPVIGQSALDAQRNACEADGGRFGPGGLSGTLVCYRQPPDAGKACRTSADCTSDCLARTMTCAPVEPLFGCNEIVEREGMTVMLCRD